MARQTRTWSLETAIERVPGGIVVVSPRGRIGSVAAGTFAEAITAARADASRVVIDLEGVDYISGRGVMVLREVASTAAGPAIICGLSEPVRITLELAGLLDVVSIENNREAAIDRFRE